MNSAKLKRIGIAVTVGTWLPLLLLLGLSVRPAHGAPSRQAPVLEIGKESASHWTRRLKLTFSNAPTGTVTDFPALVVLNSSRIDYAEMGANGEDIRFVDTGGNLLDYEIERWNPAGDSVVWVKVPQITSTSDYIWLYYGNNNAVDAQNPPGVWSNNYRGVWHMANLSDASPFQNDGQSTLPPATTVAGQVGNAKDYYTSLRYIDVGSDNSIDNIFETGGTLSAWINPSGWGWLDKPNRNFGRILDKSGNRFAYDGWGFELDEKYETLRFERGYGDTTRGAWVGSPTNTINLNVWQHVAVVYRDGLTPTFYINGVAQDSKKEPDSSDTGTAVSDANQDLWLGNFSGVNLETGQNDRAFNGFIDEVRVVRAERSAPWILAQYRSMTDNLITYGSPENVNAIPGGIIGAPFTYTLTVTNSGTGAATGVDVLDTVPDGANYVSGGQYSSNTNSVSWTIPVVGSGQTAQVTYVVTTCQASLYNDGYQVTGSNQGVTSSPGPPLISLLTSPSLTADFQHSAEIVLGEPVAFTSTSSTNGGPILSYAWNFDNGQVGTGTSASTTFSSPGSYNVSLTVTDLCGFTDVTTQTLAVHAPVFTITKSAQPAQLSVGDRLTYTVVVANNGLGAATGVVISDSLSPDVQFDAGSVTIEPPSAGGAIGSPPRLVQDLTMLPGSQVTVTYAVTVTGGTSITNTAAVTSNQTPVPVTDSTTVSVVQPPPLTISKIGQPALVRPGQRLTYTITVSNSGASPASGGVISDFIPANTQFVAGSVSIIPSGAGTVGSLPKLITGLNVPAGAQVTVTFAVTVSRPLTNGTVLINTAAVTGNQSTTSTTATNVVVAVPDVNIQKSGPPTGTIGSRLVFTFTVTNPGDSLLQVQAVNDNLAGPATFIGGDSNGNGWVELTETWLYTAAYTVQPDAPILLVNTVTVTATDGTGAQVTDSSQHTTNLSMEPVLAMTKTGPSSAVVGETVVFTFTVFHAPQSDGSPLHNVTVEDDYAGPAVLVSNGDGDPELEVGETWVFTAGYTILPTTPNPFVNTGQVSASDVNDNPITATAQHTTTLSGFDPKLFVDKDGPATARVGETVVYTFTIINVDLVAVQLFDLGPISAAAIGDGSPINLTSVVDSVAGAGVYVSGDFNSNNRLDGAEAWVYTASHVIPMDEADPLMNTVQVTGQDQEGDPVSAMDTHRTDILPEPILYFPIIFKNGTP